MSQLRELVKDPGSAAEHPYTGYIVFRHRHGMFEIVNMNGCPLALGESLDALSHNLRRKYHFDLPHDNWTTTKAYD